MDSFYSKMERKDEQVLNDFNKQLNFFTEMIYNPKGDKSEIDVYAKDKKGRKVHLEVKQRIGKYSDFGEFVKKFDTIFIECGKLYQFSRIMQSGYTLNEQELFLNIFNGGDIITIHNLSVPQPIQWLPNQKIYNKGTKQWEYEHRVGLYWNTALIYSKDENGKYRRWTQEDIDEMYDYSFKNDE